MRCCGRVFASLSSVQISAKSDYAVRAALEIARHGPDLVTTDTITSHQGLPRKFAEAILAELRKAGIIQARRGAGGGYLLSRPPDQITVGSIIRAVDGPLAEISGVRPHEITYDGAAEHLPTVWVAVRTAIRGVLDETTLQQVLDGRFPAHVRKLAQSADAWLPR